jgi:hypothetical protein
MEINWLGFDWYLYFYPALKMFVSGANPYLNSSMEVGCSPWTFLLLSPLGFLPTVWGLIVLEFINITGLIALCFRHKSRWSTIPVALSLPFIATIIFGNIDGLSLWGLAIGGPVGLILLSTKPQTAFLVGIVWGWQAWKKGKLPATARLVLPLIILATIMAFLYPDWIKHLLWFKDRTDGYLTNGFPWLIPVGIASLVYAIRHGKEEWAAVATVLLSPYVRVQSWIGALALLTLAFPLEGSIAAIASWIVLPILANR